MLTVYVIDSRPWVPASEWRYRLDHYSDAEVLKKEIDTDFPGGWIVTRITGLKYVDPRTSLEDLYEMEDLLESEDGEAFRLYVEHLLDASYAFDTFNDAYKGYHGDLETYAFSTLDDDDYETPPGFGLVWDRIAWQCDYMDLEGHIFEKS